MNKWIPPLLLGFGCAMMVIIAERMSQDAMAAVIGVVVGVAASVPTSLLLVALLRRERRTWGATGSQTPVTDSEDFHEAATRLPPPGQ